MNKANWNTWLTTLETTDLKQGGGYLYFDGGYCCLGVGCTLVPEIVAVTIDNPPAPVKSFDGQQTLAPWSFIQWLGLDTQVGYEHPEERGWDIEVDTTGYEHLTSQGHDGEAVEFDVPLDTITCASMNDDMGLSFPQIADMLRYFGPRRVIT